MRIASFCSGIGVPEIAAHRLGWESAFLSEIDARASAVLAYRFPDIPNLGNMLEIDGYEWRNAVDILVAGTPCQGFSNAGARQGLRDDRSALALKFVEHLASARPRWFVWENVPNCRSTNNGRDFAKFLGCLSGRAINPPAQWRNAGTVDGYANAYGLAWRVLDAQYFGVAQRRKRVFVVGCLGGWASAAKALFEPKGLPGNPEAIAQAVGQSAPILAGTAGTGCERGRTILSFTANDHGKDCGTVCPTLRSGTGARRSSGVKAAIVTDDTLRTFTVRETERLQGLPDDWTLVPYNGRPMADCWRRGMVGNAIAVPVIEWILNRIDSVEKPVSKYE